MITSKEFSIKVVGLNESNKEHKYNIKDNFFNLYEHNPIQKGNLKAKVSLKEGKDMLVLLFQINGNVELTCDRTLDEFKYPINVQKEVYYEIGDKEDEIDIDTYMISNKTSHINIAQHLHDFINLAVPIKKLHPRFENENDEDGIIYSYK